MKIIQKHDKGAAVEDVQQRLSSLRYLEEDQVTGIFDEATSEAVRSFCKDYKLDIDEVIDEKVWAALVDATFKLGDRTLYLRMPYFHGNDVFEIQQALSALGFACGSIDGIFGAHTESALRKYQLNLGLPADGIAGALTYASLRNLQYSWVGKEVSPASVNLGFARAADVLEKRPLCLFGTNSFSRSVASRMSNLSLATTPASKVVSADSLLVVPDETMLLVHVVMPDEKTPENVPRVTFDEEDTLALRLRAAIDATTTHPARVALELPSLNWGDAGEDRSAQHYAINSLDALCSALSQD